MQEDHSKCESAPHEQMLSCHSSGLYRIQVQGSIDSRSSRYLESAPIRVINLSRGAVTTELTVRVADQSMLVRVLEQIFTRRLPLISVEFLGVNRDEEP